MAEINTNNQNFLREEESSLRLADLWNMIWGYKWWYLVSIIIFLLIGAFYLYRTPNVYNRAAKVIIDERNQDATMRNLGFGGSTASWPPDNLYGTAAFPRGRAL